MERKAWIDYIKALAIIMVVYGHAALYYKPEEPSTLYMCVIHIIYAIHMPLFFFVSGYLYKPHEAKKLWHTIFKPMFSFFLICFVFRYKDSLFPFDGAALIKELTGTCISLFYNYKGQYTEFMTGAWFLATLFFLRLFGGDLLNKSNELLWKNKYLISVILVVVLSIASLFFKHAYAVINAAPIVKAATCCMPFFLFGKIIREHENRFLTCSKTTTAILLIAFIAMALANTFIHRKTMQFIDLNYSRIGNPYLLTYIASILAVIAFANLFRNFKANKVIISFSSGTLFILGTHTVLLYLFNLLANSFGIYLGNFHALSLTILSMVILYFLLIPVKKRFNFLLGK